MTIFDSGSTDPLLIYRERFPILEQTNYLISNSLGAVPREVEKSMSAYFQTWAELGVQAWEEVWWDLAAETGNLVAPLIGAGLNEVVFLPNVTLAHATIFSAFAFDRGRHRVVTDSMHFPSILYLLDQLSDRGAEVVVVPDEDGIRVDSERVAAEIDENTAFVNLSHVLFRSSYIHNLQPIVDRARAVGAFTIIDGYQAVGSIPVDVRQLGVDIYMGGCLKWLCGGPGNAFLWVAPERISELSPRLTGWMAHRRPFAFEPTFDRRDDAWRFLNGTPAIPSLYAARPGLELIQEIGALAIREKSLAQTSYLIEKAHDAGFRVHAPDSDQSRGGTVAIDAPHGAAVSRALKARRILCDYRPGAGIRLSPHFYNRQDELDEAIEAIIEIETTDSWRGFVDATSPVT